MDGDDGLAALRREHVGDVLAIVLKEILCKAGGALCSTYHGEVAFLVAVSVG